MSVKNSALNINDDAILNKWPTHNQQTAHDVTQDHFIIKDGKQCAGSHFIIDMWGATNLDNLEIMEAALKKAVEVAKATLLHIHLHHFTPNGGISGVAVLAESHISVHTWPERNYAAFDIFMCGDSEPAKGAEVLNHFFRPENVTITELLRGCIDEQ